MTVDIDELERLHAEATREPWGRDSNNVVAPDGYSSIAIVTGAHPELAAANAALIVALLNALPEIVALLKAAETMREALKFYASPYGQKSNDGWLVNVPDFYDELDFGDRAQQALAAYDKAKG